MGRWGERCAFVAVMAIGMTGCAVRYPDIPEHSRLSMGALVDHVQCDVAAAVQSLRRGGSDFSRNIDRFGVAIQITAKTKDDGYLRVNALDWSFAAGGGISGLSLTPSLTTSAERSSTVTYKMMTADLLNHRCNGPSSGAGYVFAGDLGFRDWMTRVAAGSERSSDAVHFPREFGQAFQFLLGYGAGAGAGHRAVNLIASTGAGISRLETNILNIAFTYVPPPAPEPVLLVRVVNWPSAGGPGAARPPQAEGAGRAPAAIGRDRGRGVLRGRLPIDPNTDFRLNQQLDQQLRLLNPR